jgi:hypothetical protein
VAEGQVGIGKSEKGHGVGRIIDAGVAVVVGRHMA